VAERIGSQNFDSHSAGLAANNVKRNTQKVGRASRHAVAAPEFRRGKGEGTGRVCRPVVGGQGEPSITWGSEDVNQVPGNTVGSRKQL
jgi:hypothetical protein